MIPFSRMIKYGNVIPTSTDILDLDFSTMQVGSTVLYDGSGQTFQQLGGFVGVVRYDSDLGANVYDCAGNLGYARTPYPIQGTKFDLSQYDAFEIKYSLKFSSSDMMNFFETGTFGSRRIGGIANAFNQFPATYNQLFIDTGVNDNFYRILSVGVNPNAWDEITMTFRKGIEITVHSKFYNNTQTFPWYNIVSSGLQYFSLFGSYVNGDIGASPNPYTGKVGFVRIREL